MTRSGLRVLSAIMFFPRGGSAFVVRALAHGLSDNDVRVRVLSGSRDDTEYADAHRFYEGLDVVAVDFAPALASPDPLHYEGPAGTAPIHPSFEDRGDAPDPVFARLDDAEFERQVQAWARAMARADAESFDVLHLHHLTPLNEAAARVAPRVPVVGHLHGTELLMLEEIDRGAPPGWTYANRWAERMRAWAARCACLLVPPGGIARAAALLGVAEERFQELPNGFDPERFRRRDVDRQELWRRHLVETPRGWRPGGEPGSVAYRSEDLTDLASAPVLLYSGRFTAVKRIELLLGAYARARPRLTAPAPLVLVGGYPGEWEGEHPAETVRRLGLDDVFLAGWHDQRELPEMLSAADLLLMPSAREHFGQVLVEAMACEVPAIAARSPGPESIIDDGQSGWLVPVDDEAALTEAIVAAVNDGDDRSRRAHEARRVALERYSWPAISGRVAELLARAASPRGAGGQAGATPPAPARAAAEV